MVAAVDSCDGEARVFQRLNYPCPRYDRDAAWHKSASYQKSGYVECQRQLVGYSDLLDEQFQAGAQVGNRFFLRFTLAERCNARTEVSRRGPSAVLILLDDVGHVNDTSHTTEYAMRTLDNRREALSTRVNHGHRGTVAMVGASCEVLSCRCL